MPHAVILITFHSTPYLVGRTVANASGSFSATVSVPEDAASGTHHFVAAGESPSGKIATLVTPVLVLPIKSGHSHALETGVMIGLAVLMPAGTWLGLNLAGRRRTRARARP
jgi:hypothetical protein